MVLSGSRAGVTEAARSAPLLSLQRQRGMFLPASTGLTSKPGAGIAEEEVSDTGVDGEDENDGDDLLASLAEELVWKGDDEEEEGEEKDREMDAMDLESFGISMLVRCWINMLPAVGPPARRADGTLLRVLDNPCSTTYLPRIDDLTIAVNVE